MSDKVVAAIHRQQKKRKARAVVIGETTIRVTQDAIKVTGSHQLWFTRPADADEGEARLLVFDPAVQAFRPVLTPPGMTLELVEKRQGPQLWKPGMDS